MYPPRPDPTSAEPDLPKPAKLPPVSAYWPDLPQRIGPPADYYSWGPDARTAPSPRPARLPDIEQPLSPAPPPRRRHVFALVAVAAILAVTGLTTLAATRWRADDREPAAAPLLPSAPVQSEPVQSEPVQSAKAEPATAATPAGGLQQATFVVASDATEVNLRTADLAGDLYRISSPAGSSVRPSVTVKDGTVRLILVDTGRRGPSAADIVLSSAVRWSLQVDGNLRAGDLDLRGSRVARVGLTGDAADLRLVMPPPDSAVPVRVTGGINRLRISVPGRTPMRVRTRGGAGEVVLDGKTFRGVARNSTFETEEWRDGADGVEIDATAGLGALRAERRTS